MLGCKEISSVRNKKCKMIMVEKQGQPYILLAYLNRSTVEMEYRTLHMARRGGLRVPRIIQMADHEILLEYVEGKTLYEELATGPVFKVGLLAKGLAKLLKDAAALLDGWTVANVDLRSYIVAGTVLYSFDFDCMVTGSYCETVADAVLSVFCEPKIPQDRVVSFCRTFVAAAGVDPKELRTAICMMTPILREKGLLKHTDQAIESAIL